MIPRSMSLRIGLAILLVPFFPPASAQWIAFNDHAPGTGTHTNASRLHVTAVGNPASGFLRNISSGTNLPVTLSITTNAAVLMQSSAANPAPGTPLANVFGGFVDFAGTPWTSAEVAGTALVTYTFSGLKTNLFYRFHGSAVRGGDSTYANRWALCEIVGATGFTNAHSSTNVLTTARVAALTAAQAAFNSGINHTATTGDYVAWDSIRPSANGTFSVTCKQYTGPVPGGSAIGSKGYAITGIRLEEFVTAVTAPAIAPQPASASVFEGQTAVLAADATGNPLFYQWLKSGVPLPSATNRTLTIPCAQFFHAGSYSFSVSNQLGFVVSSNAQLTVFAPQLVEWGRNDYGQVNVPFNLSNVVMLAAGSWHGLALQGDGRIIGWGRNGNGQATVPVEAQNPAAIAAGFYFSMALMPDRTVRCWGDNLWGQCNVPPGLNNVVMIAAAYDAAFALRTDGTVVAWGRNNLGQTDMPPGLTNVVKIFASGYYGAALKADGTAVAWGSYDPSAGGGSVAVPGELTNIVSLAAAGLHTLALKADGTLSAWGHNEYGQATIPPGLTNIVAIAAGNGFSGSHNVVLKPDQSVATWGYNNNGQSTLPPCLPSASAIGAGEYYTAVLNASDSTVTGPVMLVSPFAMGAVGRPFHHRYAARNGPVDWRASGLPPGLACDPFTGVLTGLPRAAGEHAVTITASNALGLAARVVTLIIQPNPSAPLIVQQPQSQFVIAGSNVMFHAQAVGAPAPRVQWYFKDSALPGQTNFSLMLSFVQLGQAGDYRLWANSAGGTLWSDAATLTVLTTPQFQTGSVSVDPDAGVFHLSVKSVAPGARLVIECSTNLLDWQPVLTNTPLSSPYELSLPLITNEPARFYRALAAP